MTKPAPLAAAGRVAGAAALIAVLTVVSRLAGFGRTAVFTWTLSTSDLGGAYLVANYVPNFIFEIVAGGALASLVVPLLAGAVEAGDRRAVAATTGALLTWTLTLLVPLAVLVAIFADPLPGLIGDGLSEAQQASGARMLRVFAPQLPLYGVGIVLTGVLQAHRRFAWPVIAPLLSSISVIGVYLAFTATEGRLATIGEAGRGGELLLSAGTTLGVVVLSLSLLIPLRRLKLRIRPGYRFPADARARVGGRGRARGGRGRRGRRCRGHGGLRDSKVGARFASLGTAPGPRPSARSAVEITAAPRPAVKAVRIMGTPSQGS